MKCKEFESLIDSYLDGTIPEDKSEIFEEHYFRCDSCFSSLKISDHLYNKKIHIVTGKKRSFSSVFKPSLVLASMILIIFSSLFFVDMNDKSEQLFKVSEFAPPLYIRGENRGDRSSSAFYKAMEYYGEGEYEDAYRVITSPQVGTPQLWFFRGILALLNGENRDALSHFDQIISIMDPSYYDEAVFYRGISLLRMNRKNDALDEFKMLEKMFSPLSHKAVDMVRKISAL